MNFYTTPFLTLLFGLTLYEIYDFVISLFLQKNISFCSILFLFCFCPCYLCTWLWWSWSWRTWEWFDLQYNFINFLLNCCIVASSDNGFGHTHIYLVFRWKKDTCVQDCQNTCSGCCSLWHFSLVLNLFDVLLHYLSRRVVIF